jgi:hypothetical protein
MHRHCVLHSLTLDDDMHVLNALALAVEQVLRGVSLKRLLDFKCHHLRTLLRTHATSPVSAALSFELG